MKRIGLWVGVLAVLTIIVGGLVVMVKSAANGAVAVGGVVSGAAAGILPSDWVRGNKDAKVVLVEYGDYQCPGCASFDPILREIMETHGEKIAFVYRNFPLSSIHRNADFSARAAEAAGKQGKFWGMHDMLFDKQPLWAESLSAEKIFTEYAGVLGLDTAKFTNDMTLREIRKKINEDYKLGVAAGVAGTPSFYINGVPTKPVSSKEEFIKQIDDAIANANS